MGNLMKNILVTGANGYVGQELINRLVHQNYNVFCITRSIPNKELKRYKNVKWYNFDLKNEDNIQELFLNQKFDYVVHLAGLAHKKNNKNLTKEDFFEENEIVSKYLFETTKKYKVPIFFASTVEVYGLKNDEIVDECFSTNPISYYAKSKLAAENILREIYKDELSKLYTIARFGMVYGKDIRKDLDKRIYLKHPKYMYKLSKNIYYHFVSINNILDFILHSIENVEVVNGIYNLVDTDYISANTLLKFESLKNPENKIITIPKIIFTVSRKLLSNLKILESVSYSLKKIEDPPKYSNIKMLGVITPKWNFENTLYNKNSE